jgi:hypothetical protein
VDCLPWRYLNIGAKKYVCGVGAKIDSYTCSSVVKVSAELSSWYVMCLNIALSSVLETESVLSQI